MYSMKFKVQTAVACGERTDVTTVVEHSELISTEITGYGWGIGSGSSNNPGSETYHGPAPFSEPETQAVWNYVQQINPSISFTMHSVAGRYLNPMVIQIRRLPMKIF